MYQGESSNPQFSFNVVGITIKEEHKLLSWNYVSEI